MNFPSIAVSIVLVIFFIGGITSCFFGYRRFMVGVRSSGFFIGGLLGFLVVFPFAIANKETFQILIILAVGFVVGGILGFAFSVSMNKVLTFFTGAIIGFFLSILVFSPKAFEIIFKSQLSLAGLQNALGNLFPLHLAIAMCLGILAIFFQRPIIIVSTSIWGAAWIMLPICVGYYWLTHQDGAFQLEYISLTLQIYRVTLLSGWIVFTVLGSLFQFRYAVKKPLLNKDRKEKKHRLFSK